LDVEPAPKHEESLEPSFVPFGEVVVNVNEGRMNRYLRMRITLQTSGGPEKEAALITHVEKKKAIMTSWLLGHLADMSMEDIRGAAGQNRLRREIHDQFNWILFPDGEHAIEDVLFEEFNVQ
jgi:flagellar basal body-associated protein FliL